MKKRNIFKRVFAFLLSSSLVFGGATEVIGESEKSSFNENSNNTTQVDVDNEVVVLGKMEPETTTTMLQEERKELPGFRESLKVNTQTQTNEQAENSATTTPEKKAMTTPQNETGNQGVVTNNNAQLENNNTNQTQNEENVLNFTSRQDYYRSSYLPPEELVEWAKYDYLVHSTCEIGRQVAGMKEIIDRGKECTVIIDGREVKIVGYIISDKQQYYEVVREEIPDGGYGRILFQTCVLDNGNETTKKYVFYSKYDEGIEAEVVKDQRNVDYGGCPNLEIVRNEKGRIIDINWPPEIDDMNYAVYNKDGRYFEVYNAVTGEFEIYENDR